MAERIDATEQPTGAIQSCQESRGLVFRQRLYRARGVLKEPLDLTSQCPLVHDGEQLLSTVFQGLHTAPFCLLAGALASLDFPPLSLDLRLSLAFFDEAADDGRGRGMPSRSHTRARKLEETVYRAATVVMGSAQTSLYSVSRVTDMTAIVSAQGE